jgi:hypothetical protein
MAATPSAADFKAPKTAPPPGAGASDPALGLYA